MILHLCMKLPHSYSLLLRRRNERTKTEKLFFKWNECRCSHIPLIIVVCTFLTFSKTCRIIVWKSVAFEMLFYIYFSLVLLLIQARLHFIVMALLYSSSEFDYSTLHSCQLQSHTVLFKIHNLSYVMGSYFAGLFN